MAKAHILLITVIVLDVFLSLGCVKHAIWPNEVHSLLSLQERVRPAWFAQCVVASESGASGTYGFTYNPPFPPHFFPLTSFHLLPVCKSPFRASKSVRPSSLACCVYPSPSLCAALLEVYCVWGDTCALKKAGVREPEGSAGLLRAMETRSLPVRRSEEEISRPLGFLPSE